MRRRRRLALVVLLGSPLLGGFVPAVAPAQTRTGFAVSRLEPAERGSDRFVVDGLDFRTGGPSIGATLDYAHKPLAVYDAAGNDRVALVRHQLLLHGGASWVFAGRLRLGLDLPVAIYQDGEPATVRGEAFRAATAPALADLRLAADARVIGHGDGGFTLALGLRGWLPTGVRSQFTSDGSARLAPQVLASGGFGWLRWAARAAFVARFRDDAYAAAPLGSEIAGAFGLGVRSGRLLVGPEVFAATKVDGLFARHATPADLLLAAHYRHPSGLAAGVALGGGLSSGYGSPAARAVVSIEWGPPAPRERPDRDHDGIMDEHDACPDWPGAASSDPETNGCPEAERVPDEDTDADRVFDRDDACPTVAGVRTSDPMTSGCPAGTPRQLAVVTTTEIRIGERIQFATDSAELLAESDGVLQAVKQLLETHPELRRIEVEGHTDATGTSGHNDELSARRAAAVTAWLVEHGVDPARLASRGYGSRRPVDTNETEAGRANNRRVLFTITERQPRR